MATLSKAALPVPVWITASPVRAGKGEETTMGRQSHLCPATPPYRGIVVREAAPFTPRTSACAVRRWFRMHLAQQEQTPGMGWEHGLVCCRP